MKPPSKWRIQKFGQRFAEVQVLVLSGLVWLGVAFDVRYATETMVFKSSEGRESMQGRSKDRKISKGKKIKINTVMKPEADSRLRLGIF